MSYRLEPDEPLAPGCGGTGFLHEHQLFRLPEQVPERQPAGEPRVLLVVPAVQSFEVPSEPDTVRAPDVAFVSGQRAGGRIPPEGYAELAPGLVVEVVMAGRA